MTELERTLQHLKLASLGLSKLSGKEKNQFLLGFADALQRNQSHLIEENAKDLELQKGKISESLLSRLKLDSEKLNFVTRGIRDLASMPDPVGKVVSQTLLDDHLTLTKKTTPLGVIAIVFESRPDVVPQVLSLALKSGNAIVMKGGSEALNSNRALFQIMKDAIPLKSEWAALLETREEIKELLAYDQYIDLVIPRGSNELVQMVMNSTKIPVLGHADGVCHIFIDESALLEMATSVSIDAKVQYPSACNSMETLLIHKGVAQKFLSAFEPLARSQKVVLKGCPEVKKILPQVSLATEADFYREYGDLTLNLKVVAGLDEAISHIHKFGSQHTDAIITQNTASSNRFLDEVDSANVFVNASTRFADGYRYGFGAEVGISTSKTHARGPVGLEGLLSYKYQLVGNGQVVADYVGSNPKKFLHKKIF